MKYNENEYLCKLEYDLHSFKFEKYAVCVCVCLLLFNGVFFFSLVRYFRADSAYDLKQILQFLFSDCIALDLHYIGSDIHNSISLD